LLPHSHIDTPKWLSPTQRCGLFFKDLLISKRLRRQMRQGRYTVPFDRDFEEVIKACAAKREGHYRITWITPRIMHAYAKLFVADYVHSFEMWNGEGKLVGGGYGVTVGCAVTTESQFSLERASPSASPSAIPARRMQSDGLRQTLQRWVLGLLWSLKPPRLYWVPATLLMLARHYAGLGLPPGALPDPDKALRHPDGLAGICTDMSIPTLESAYRRGEACFRSPMSDRRNGGRRRSGWFPMPIASTSPRMCGGCCG
jgi:Leu/Phe-tRNA-protein transferase